MTPDDSPEIRYARSGDVQIAYEVVGDGPIDILLVPAWASNIEPIGRIPGRAT